MPKTRHIIAAIGTAALAAVLLGVGALLWLQQRDREIRSASEHWARELGLASADRPLWVVTQLAREGMSFAQVREALAPLERVPVATDWLHGGGRIVERLRFPSEFKNEVVYLEYSNGVVANIDGGDFPVGGLRALSRDSAYYLLNHYP